MFQIVKWSRYLNHVRNIELVPCSFQHCKYQSSSTSDVRGTKNKDASKDQTKDSSTDMLTASGLTEDKQSKAMRAYLDRAQKYSAFMKQQQEEYTTGKRHLANMMGRDPESFTQVDVDEAIEYLFPSGLFVPAARPFMKPPEKVFPPRKEAEFDDAGRPFHFLFYTGKPNFYHLLHEFNKNLSDLNDYEDKMIRKHLQPDPNVKIQLSGSVWISKEDLETRLVEQITDKEYGDLISLLERIILHPYAYNIKDDIVRVRAPIMDVKMDFSKPPKPSYDNTGRPYITTTDCPRKSARSTVTVWCPGTGVININGEDISYFADVQSREQVIESLIKLLRCRQ